MRSDRRFCEQLDYNLLFRWFLDMSADEPTFDASLGCRRWRRALLGAWRASSIVTQAGRGVQHDGSVPFGT